MEQKDTMETKLCRHCQTQISKKAKVCPNCRKKVKGGGCLTWILVGLAAAVLLAMFSGGGEGSEEPEKVGTVSAEETVENNTEETAPVQTEYRVGDILQDGDLKIVFVSSGIYEEENEYSQPEEGFEYIFLEFAFENISGDSDASVSLYDFACYADGYNVEMYYGGDEDLSAALSPGRTTSGYVYFTVPVDAQQIEVEYTTNLFTEEKIDFIYEGEKSSGYTPARNTEPTPGAYQVGDAAECGDVVITYLSCQEYESDNQFAQPREGFKFVTCEFEFENLGDSDEHISSWDFDCFADGVSCEQTYIRDDDLSADLSAGRKAKGTVTFEVPVDAAVVEVEYLANYWTSSRLVFNAK